VDETRTDAELVDAANGGDAEALGALYVRYREWAVSLAFRLTGDREMALDVMQEAFVYLFSKFPGFRLRAKMTTFLYPAIRNTALAARRKKRAVADETAIGAYPAAVATGAIGPELAAAVSRLPDAQREVLLMRVVDEMSVGEIALALGIPEGTVKSRLHHAVGTLRGERGLRGYWEGM
jgi:RNA polymerase sigma-70 factor, ECF subfamily